MEGKRGRLCNGGFEIRDSLHRYIYRFDATIMNLEPRFSLCSAPERSNNPCMGDHVYKKIELVGSSPAGFDEAVKNALARAAKTVRNMRWFEVLETRGYIEEGNIAHWQVTLKVGFTLEG